MPRNRVGERHFSEEGELKQPLTPSVFPTSLVKQSASPFVGAPNYDRHRLRLGSKLRRNPHHKPLITVALVSIVSLVAIISCVALCYSHHNKAKTSGLAKRRLSDTADAKELSDILEQCVELEEELGLTGKTPTTNERGWYLSSIYDSAAAFERDRGVQPQAIQGDSLWHMHGLGTLSKHLSNPNDWRETASYAVNDNQEESRLRDSFGALVSDSDEQQIPYGVQSAPLPPGLPHSVLQQQTTSDAFHRPSDGTTNSPLGPLNPDSWLETNPWQIYSVGEPQMPHPEAGKFAPAHMNVSNSQTHIGGVSREDAFNSISGSLPADNSKEFHCSGGQSSGSVVGPGAQEYRGPEGTMASNPTFGHQVHSPGNMFFQAYPEGMQHLQYMTGAEDILQATAYPGTSAGSIYPSRTTGLPLEPLVVYGEGQGGLMHGNDGYLDVGLPTIQGESMREAGQSTQGVQVLWTPHMQPTCGRCGRAIVPASISSIQEMLTHPYVRLPVVNPNDIPRSFRTNIAFSALLFEGFSLNIYVPMRELFAKPSLNSAELESLLRLSEYLVNHALHRLRTPPTRPGAFHVSRRLAELFFMFDYVVCTIELLQEKMETSSWWELFVASFRTEYYFPASYHGKRDLEKKLPRLVKRLSAALAIYKTGVRPPPQDIISLKRDIFHLLERHSVFTHRLWNFWREDDYDFCHRICL